MQGLILSAYGPSQVTVGFEGSNEVLGLPFKGHAVIAIILNDPLSELWERVSSNVHTIYSSVLWLDVNCFHQNSC